MKEIKKENINVNEKQRTDEEPDVKIKYDVHTPDERDPQPKSYDEIEY
ncbi:hypothetical protein [Anaerobacillus arseniciselenatis]|nr:hypothetical protein [Anaerobacillus arseniciselenatis]